MNYLTKITWGLGLVLLLVATLLVITNHFGQATKLITFAFYSFVMAFFMEMIKDGKKN